MKRRKSRKKVTGRKYNQKAKNRKINSYAGSRGGIRL